MKARADAGLILVIYPREIEFAWVSPSRAPGTLIDLNGETRVLLGVLSQAMDRTARTHQPLVPRSIDLLARSGVRRLHGAFSMPSSFLKKLRGILPQVRSRARRR